MASLPAPGMQRFAGKVAIVTGGAGGIGTATVERLVAEGARVVVADIEQAPAEAVAARFGDHALAVTFDAADNASIEALVQQTVSRYRRLDILCNIAALTGTDSVTLDVAAVDIALDFWDVSMAINVRSHLAACKFAIPHMIQGGGGAIVNMTSGSGIAGDLVRTAYGASKAALSSITRYVATQYGKAGVRCNAVAPGLVLTEAAKRNVPEMVESMKRHILTRELGEPADIASLVAFLASEEARYITGQTISIDGGLLSHVPQIVDMR